MRRRKEGAVDGFEIASKAAGIARARAAVAERVLWLCLVNAKIGSFG